MTGAGFSGDRRAADRLLERGVQAEAAGDAARAEALLVEAAAFLFAQLAHQFAAALAATVAGPALPRIGGYENGQAAGHVRIVSRRGGEPRRAETPPGLRPFAVLRRGA